MKRKEQNGGSVSAEGRLLALPPPFSPAAEQQLNPAHPGKGVKAFLTAKLLLAFAVWSRDGKTEGNYVGKVLFFLFLSSNPGGENSCK